MPRDRRQYSVFLTFSRAAMSEEPDEGAAAAAAADPVPEENGVADSAADDLDCSSQENPPEPAKDDGEPPGMGSENYCGDFEFFIQHLFKRFMFGFFYLRYVFHLLTH